MFRLVQMIMYKMMILVEFFITVQANLSTTGCFTLETYYGCVNNRQQCSAKYHLRKFNEQLKEIEITLECSGYEVATNITTSYMLPRHAGHCLDELTSCTFESPCPCCTQPSKVCSHSDNSEQNYTCSSPGNCTIVVRSYLFSMCGTYSCISIRHENRCYSRWVKVNYACETGNY